MHVSIAHTLRQYKKADLPKDILAGVIIAAVSIPISMGYAQIAGLPAVYGLYGSVFPILLFALFSTSPQFIFGVDAAPAALVGSALLTLSVPAGSADAAKLVPVITFWVALWLLLFSLLGAGRLVSYISAPVMGGFITGICTEIILMQIPKLMGGTAGTGELPELLLHIGGTLPHMHLPSLILGGVSLVILLGSKKLFPKFPIAVVLMAAGALLTALVPSVMTGVATLQAVDTGLPHWQIPELFAVHSTNLITISLSIAVVIMAETLLAENNFAMKNGYRIDNNQELLAFSLGNFSAAFTGCCPMNGSVSRTSMGEQYQGKTQLTGLVAGLTMMAVLLFGTGFIGYLPVPVLTAIVISALLGATEFELAERLWKINRQECLIFWGAFFGVLMLGTINGVLIGIILSFAEMIIRSAKPYRCFLGVHPGFDDFRDLDDHHDERYQILPIQGVIIYRFSSSLFFANIDILQREIEDAIQPDTRAVILDAGAIGSIDMTAADRLGLLYENLKKRHIRFYMTEHISALNDQLRSMGLGYMIEEGAVRRTIPICLRDMGIRQPYPLEGNVKYVNAGVVRQKLDSRMQEFAWAFGNQTETVLEHQYRTQMEKLKKTHNVATLLRGNWEYKEAIDEDAWIVHLEEHVKEIAQATDRDEHTILNLLEHRREELRHGMETNTTDVAERFERRKELLNNRLKQNHPEVNEYIQK